MRSNCVRNANNVANALYQPLPNSAALFVTELLQSLGNARANEREYRSQQRKIRCLVAA